MGPMPKIQPELLTAAAFAPFGCVIESVASTAESMNSERFRRFDALARLDLDAGLDGIISIAECLEPSSLPYEIDLLERHPRGSQAFVPLSACRMIVVVAAAGETVSGDDLRAFVTDGQQGVQYHRGVWHMPLIAFDAGQRFLVVDADDSEHNCDEIHLAEPVLLETPPVWP